MTAATGHLSTTQWVLFILGLVVGIRWLIGKGKEQQQDSALEILRQRYARSEINKEGSSANPTSQTKMPKQQAWAVNVSGGEPRLLGGVGCNEEGCEDREQRGSGSLTRDAAVNALAASR